MEKEQYVLKVGNNQEEILERFGIAGGPGEETKESVEAFGSFGGCGVIGKIGGLD